MSSSHTTGSRGAVTLRDIARHTDLSVSAVSMALLDHSRIGAETKARVREVADRLGYVPNSAGRALRAKKADTIALIVPNTSQHVFGHAYFMHVLTGVTDVDTHGIHLDDAPAKARGLATYAKDHGHRFRASTSRSPT